MKTIHLIIRIKIVVAAAIILNASTLKAQEWELISDSLWSDIPNYAESGTWYRDKIGTLYTDPVNGYIYAFPNRYDTYMSKDMGDTWEVVQPDEKGRYARQAVSMNYLTGDFVIWRIDANSEYIYNNRTQNKSILQIGDGYTIGAVDWRHTPVKYLLGKQHHSMNVHFSSDGGQTFNQIITDCEHIGMLNADRIVYYKTNGIYLTKDQGVTSTKVASFVPYKDAAVTYENEMFWMTESGFYVSRDSCETWQKIEGPWMNSHPKYGPFFGGSKNVFVIVGTSGVYKTLDGGSNWEKIADYFTPEADDLTHWGWDFHKNVLYCADHCGDMYRLRLPPECETKYTLTVNNGIGGNEYCEGYFFNISANIPFCYEFIEWTGDTEYLDDPTSAVAEFTMPATNASVTAIFAPKEIYQVFVTNGTSSEQESCEGNLVDISANPPSDPVNYTFDKWIGDTLYLDNPYITNPVLTMPASNINLEATYKEFSRAYGESPLVIPGQIDLELYDKGGEGIAYHDTDQNIPQLFRLDEKVDIGQRAGTSDYFLGWIGEGEWTEYTVNIEESGNYMVEISYASGGSGGFFNLLLNGEQIGSTITVTSTGGWQSFSTKKVEGFSLEAGSHILKLSMETAGYNLNYLKFTRIEYFDLTIGIDGNGTTSPQGGNYLIGTKVTLRAYPAAGHVFTGWSGDMFSDDNPLIVTMNSELNLTANFMSLTHIESHDDATNRIKMYPNPATSGLVNIETDYYSEIEIVSISGKSMLKTYGEGKIELNIFTLKSGVYIVKTTSEKDFVSQILIVK